MNVNVYQKQRKLPIASLSVKKLVIDFMEFSKISCNEVSIHFVNTKTICDYHDRFFNDPSPTDCISFPMDHEESESYRILGEVFVCPETAIEYVLNNGGDIYEETTLYVVHGLLHLLGYDDIESSDRRKMRAAEAKYLKHAKAHHLLLQA